MTSGAPNNIVPVTVGTWIVMAISLAPLWRYALLPVHVVKKRVSA